MESKKWRRFWKANFAKNQKFSSFPFSLSLFSSSFFRGAPTFPDDDDDDVDHHHHHRMWRRSFLPYKDKYQRAFVPKKHTFVTGEEKEDNEDASRVKISQCSSASELKKRFGDGDADADDRDETTEKNANVDRDPIPETGFTIWDASLLLAAYLRQKEKMEALFLPSRGSRGERARGTVCVELGAGTGAGTLLFVEAVETMMLSRTDAKNAAVRFVVTDLAPCLPLLRHNVNESQMSDIVQVSRLEWGERRREKDIESVKNMCASTQIDLVIGADLAYTSNEQVIQNLAATVKLCGSRSCVMAFCREHNPSAVDLFEKLCEDTFTIRKVTNSDPLWPEHMREDSDDFVIFEMSRRVDSLI